LSGDGEGPGAAAAGAHFTERVLEGPDGPRSAVVRNEPARLRFRLTFDARALAPSLELSVLSEDRTLVYRTTGKLGGPYEPGTEIVGAINFVPRVAGGSLRLVVSIRDADGRVLHDDVNGTLVYLAPVLGTSGVADLDATITLDGEVLTDHPEVTL
jgi:hypothetical protein